MYLSIHSVQFFYFGRSIHNMYILPTGAMTLLVLRYLIIMSFFWSHVSSKYTIDVSNTAFCVLFCRIKCWLYFRHSNEIEKQTISYFLQLNIVLYINYIWSSHCNAHRNASHWRNYFRVILYSTEINCLVKQH